MPSMAPLIGALPKLRQMAESLKSDPCVVTRPGDTTTDPDTGLTTTGKEKVYEGSCKVQPSGGLASEQPDGSAAHALRAGDVVEVTESANQLLVGRRFRLVSPQSEKTHATACRWNVKEDS